VNVAGSARTVGAWTGTATLEPGAGNDLVRIELTGSTGMTVHVLDTAGVDRLSVLGTTAPDGLIVDVVSSPPAGTGAGRVRRVCVRQRGIHDQPRHDHPLRCRARRDCHPHRR